LVIALSINGMQGRWIGKEPISFCPKGAAEQSPGLAAFLPPNLGMNAMQLQPCKDWIPTQPFQGWSKSAIFTQGRRQKARPTLRAAQPWALIFGPVGAGPGISCRATPGFDM